MNPAIWEYKFGQLHVVQLAVLRDNYSYLLRDKGSGRVAVIDPADDPKIAAELARRNWRLNAIWNTHSHFDHCGGNSALLEYTAQYAAKHGQSERAIEIAAYSRKRVAECNCELRAGQKLFLGNLAFQVYEVPGHTLDHLLFTCQIKAEEGLKDAAKNEEGEHSHSLAFCGDALFSLGCGRLFEGTAQQMLASLDCLAALPPQTVLFCGHNYTQANLRFALWLEPKNQVLQQWQKRRENMVAASNLAWELAANPFLRLREESLATAMAQRLPDWPDWPAAKRLAQLRKMKDNF